MSSLFSKLWDAIVVTCSDHKTALEFEKGIYVQNKLFCFICVQTEINNIAL